MAFGMLDILRSTQKIWALWCKNYKHIKGGSVSIFLAQSQQSSILAWAYLFKAPPITKVHLGHMS